MRRAQPLDPGSILVTDARDSAQDDPCGVPAAVTGNDGQLVGPHALMLAVLEDAIHCAGLTPPERRPELLRLRLRARRWVRSGDQDWLFSFEGICDALSIDAGRLRRRVLHDAPSAPGGRRRRIHGLPRLPAKLERA